MSLNVATEFLMYPAELCVLTLLIQHNTDTVVNVGYWASGMKIPPKTNMFN